MLTTHLTIFVTVAEKKNFSRAAEALQISQPAISQQIHSLEDYYGMKLFVRTSKRVELTQAGETLLPYAKKVLELVNAAHGALDDLMGRVTGQLKIGASLTIGEYILPHLLAEYTKRFPEVEMNVLIHNTEDIAAMALEHSIDVAVVEGRVEHRHLTMTPFSEDELVLIAASDHPLAGTRIQGTLLAAETFLLREAGSGTRVVAEAALGALGITPAKIVTLGSTQSIKEAVEAGLGVAILSKWCIRKELRFGTLARLDIEDFAFTRPLSVLERVGQFKTRAVEEFIALVKTYPYPA